MQPIMTEKDHKQSNLGGVIEKQQSPLSQPERENSTKVSSSPSSSIPTYVAIGFPEDASYLDSTSQTLSFESSDLGGPAIKYCDCPNCSQQFAEAMNTSHIAQPSDTLYRDEFWHDRIELITPNTRIDERLSPKMRMPFVEDHSHNPRRHERRYRQNVARAHDNKLAGRFGGLWVGRHSRNPTLHNCENYLSSPNAHHESVRPLNQSPTYYRLEPNVLLHCYTPIWRSLPSVKRVERSLRCLPLVSSFTPQTNQTSEWSRADYAVRESGSFIGNLSQEPFAEAHQRLDARGSSCPSDVLTGYTPTLLVPVCEMAPPAPCPLLTVESAHYERQLDDPPLMVARFRSMTRPRQRYNETVLNEDEFYMDDSGVFRRLVENREDNVTMPNFYNPEQSQQQQHQPPQFFERKQVFYHPALWDKYKYLNRAGREHTCCPAQQQ